MSPPIDGKTRETLVLVGVFGFLAIALMTLRLYLRKFRQQRFILSDYLTITCIVFVLARTAFTTVVLVWGNNNATKPFTNLSEEELYQRTVGSKLTLVNRAVYNTYLWIQKGVVLLLCERVLLGLHWTDLLIKVYWGVLGASLIAVQVTTFSECNPIRLYWQVVPSPGTCNKAHVELITLVALNIITDAMLIMLPMPWLFTIRRSWTLRLQLIGLFSIGLLLIAIALVRLPLFASSTSQVNRNTWGSVEEFFAAFVANVPTLFTLRHDRPDSNFHSSHSTSQTPPRRTTRSGFRQFDDDILVTNSIQLEYEHIDRPQGDHKQAVSTSAHHASNDNLV